VVDDKNDKGSVRYETYINNFEKKAKEKERYSDNLKTYVNKITLEHLNRPHINNTYD
jgi:hypothetical protein